MQNEECRMRNAAGSGGPCECWGGERVFGQAFNVSEVTFVSVEI
jgi:hypothetical protein